MDRGWVGAATRVRLITAVSSHSRDLFVRPPRWSAAAMSKFWRYVILAFVVFYIVVFKDSAVSILQGTWHNLDHFAHSLGDFLNRLTGDKSSSTYRAPHAEHRRPGRLLNRSIPAAHREDDFQC